jgi:hypothetical protein
MLSPEDVIVLVSLVLPLLIPLGQALYKHLVDALPSNQRQAVVDTVRIATHALAADPSIAQDAETAAATILKELRLPATPVFIKSLVALFKQDVVATQPQDSQDSASLDPHPTLGFVVPPVAHPTGPSLHR